MESIIEWKGGFTFEAKSGSFSIPMDANYPVGNNHGSNPKEVLLSALAAEAGMDVMGILKKKKQKLDSFKITAMGNQDTKNYPNMFTRIDLIFEIVGIVDYDEVLKAVQLSQNLYCGISAMICETVPVKWVVFVDGVNIGTGTASFNRNDDFYQTSFEG